MHCQFGASQQATTDDIDTVTGVDPAPEQLPSHGRFHQYDFCADELSVGSKKRRHDAEDIKEEDGEDDDTSEPKKNPGRRKIDIEYIQDKSKRHITFSKRKAGIMKKAYELATLTGTQLLLLVVSETGIVYNFTTPKLEPIVSVDPGKSLITVSCSVGSRLRAVFFFLIFRNHPKRYLNDGEGEVQLEQEDPSESHLGQRGTMDETEATALSSSQPSTSKDPTHLAKPLGNDVYRPSIQSGSLPTSFLNTKSLSCFQEPGESLTPAYEFLNSPALQNLYPTLEHQMGLSSGDDFSTLHEGLNMRPPGHASFLDLPVSQHISSLSGSISSDALVDSHKIKRRRTETDLRAKAIEDEQNSMQPYSLNQCSLDPQQAWFNSNGTMKFEPFVSERTSVGVNSLNNVAISFIIQESGKLPSSIPLELENSHSYSRLEKNVALFLDACDHNSFGDPLAGNGKWRETVFPSKHLLNGCLKFFLEEYLALFKTLSLVDFMACCDDLQKLVQYLALFYEHPEQASAELSEIIKNSSNVSLKNLKQTNQPSTALNPPPLPSSYNLKLKSAPKLKPRKGVNVTLRGGRLQAVLEEYTAWCRKNKGFWSGNNPNSRVKGWFKVERVRPDLSPKIASSSIIPGVLKIRFPTSAVKLIRKGDWLELEVEQSDNGQEWNIFRHTGFDLFGGDESEEETNWLDYDGIINEPALQASFKTKGISPEEIQKYVENLRLIKLHIEAGDLEDDGFESKVPPKGGRQAFRLKKPHAGNGIKRAASDSQPGDSEESWK
ncbi:hypothetical protein O181_024835 [Austropuccinia psidii MF-1]|uniref:MADS-box domain-containing protein n=1 Tax=Austropuccinia psidii MF-1 TaxID=1389203 RepID=A0A9Q3CLA2_9BASI|nr:hypothetical protein [Austropuccinia psidii MF-1]